jgi:ribosomal subunit interface protein
MLSPNFRHIDTSKFIIRGVQLDLTESLRLSACDKAARLFQHNEPIDRVMIDLEIDRTRGPADRFIAKGRVQVEDGPDLVASAYSENTYKALDLLMETLDALLSTRHELRKEPSRHADLGHAIPIPGAG